MKEDGASKMSDIIRFPNAPDRPDDLDYIREKLTGGGGGPTSGGMEERVRQLENELSYLKGKIEDMPTKDWMTTRLAWIAGAIVLSSGVVSGVIQYVGVLVSAAP